MEVVRIYQNGDINASNRLIEDANLDSECRVDDNGNIYVKELIEGEDGTSFFHISEDGTLSLTGTFSEAKNLTLQMIMLRHFING